MKTVPWPRKPIAVLTGLLVAATCLVACDAGAAEEDQGATVVAVRAQDGRQVWAIPDGPTRHRGLTAAGGKVYYWSQRGSLIARDAADGSELWKRSGLDPRHGPVVGAGVVIVSHGGDQLLGLDARDGSEIWRSSLSVAVLSLVANREGAFAVGTDRHLYALQPDDGRTLWRSAAPVVADGDLAQGPHPLSAGPFLVGSTILIDSLDGAMTAYATASGQEVWSVPSRGLVHAEEVEDAIVVSEAGPETLLRALRAADGTEVWMRTIPQPSATFITIGGDVFAFTAAPAARSLPPNPPSVLSGFRGSDGSEMWDREVRLCCLLRGADGTLIVVDRSSGKGLAVDPTDGSIAWRASIVAKDLIEEVVADASTIVADTDEADADEL